MRLDDQRFELEPALAAKLLTLQDQSIAAWENADFDQNLDIRLESCHGPVFRWTRPASLLPLLAGEVHIWSAPLRLPEWRVRKLASFLSPEERASAERFHFEKDRIACVTSKGLQREILGKYLNRLPASLTFANGKSGKPGLILDGSPASSIQYNVSHSCDLLLIALARGRPVGVDVERIRRIADRDLVARSFFASGEIARFQGLLERSREIAFFNCWTRKEAFLKARGDGITEHLDAFEVSFEPGLPARVLRCADGFDNPRDWSLIELEPVEGYAASLAIPGFPARITCLHWESGRY